ncbi:hypothetical protein BGZ60DRAFT_112329 [Tricladium varicosporioides]|nr:hypothetical protein BGZ60DRAFT_112329 [Hymenoscyphus varicosporioides]
MLQLETADGEHFNLPYTMDFFSPKVHGRGVNISRLSPNGWALHQTSVNILSMMAVLGRVHHGKRLYSSPLQNSFKKHSSCLAASHRPILTSPREAKKPRRIISSISGSVANAPWRHCLFLQWLALRGNVITFDVRHALGSGSRFQLVVKLIFTPKPSPFRGFNTSFYDSQDFRESLRTRRTSASHTLTFLGDCFNITRYSFRIAVQHFRFR